MSTEDTTWLTARDVLSPGMVQSFLQTSNGDVWIATHYGLTRFDGRSFRSFTQANGLARPSALAEDREGNLWIATLNGGVQRLAIDGFRTYAESDGLSDSVVRTITEDAAGQLYFISQNQHFHRFDGDRFISVRPNLRRDVTELEGVGWATQDRSGEWWIPGAAGLYRFPRVSRLDDLARVRPRLYTARDGLAGEDVRSLFEDSRGDIWIGRRLATSLVLTRWARSTDTFHRYGEADGLPPFSRVLSFAEDQAGNVWFGFQNGGIARHRQGRFDTFTSSHGAPANDVAAMHVDRRGRLWIGGQKPSLSRIDEPDADRPRFISYTPARPLSGDSVGCIVEDRDGRLYLCSVGGPLDLLDPDTGDVRRFTSANGLIGADLLSGHQDRRGNVWFGSYNGVLRLIPTADPAKNTPAVRIGAVRVAGENYLTSDLGESSVPAFELGPRQNRIQIEFFALGLVQGTGVRYQYQARRRRQRLESTHRPARCGLRQPGARPVPVSGAGTRSRRRRQHRAGFGGVHHPWPHLAALVVSSQSRCNHLAAGVGRASGSRRAPSRARAGAHAHRGRPARRHRRQPLTDRDSERSRSTRSGNARRAAGGPALGDRRERQTRSRRARRRGVVGRSAAGRSRQRVPAIARLRR